MIRRVIGFTEKDIADLMDWEEHFDFEALRRWEEACVRVSRYFPKRRLRLKLFPESSDVSYEECVRNYYAGKLM